MGQARQRQKALAADLAAVERAAAIVGPALKKMATAASHYLGADCVLHADLGRQALERLGIKAELVAGFSAWQLGAGPGDILSHHTEAEVHAPVQGDKPGFPYHAWLRAGDILIDFSTYQLPLKAAHMDAVDGHHTDIQWCPDYLVAPMTSVVSYRVVANSRTPGHYHYQHVPEIQAMVTRGLDGKESEDLPFLLTIMKNPQAHVVGPNSIA